MVVCACAAVNENAMANNKPIALGKLCIVNSIGFGCDEKIEFEGEAPVAHPNKCKKSEMPILY